MIGTLRSAWRCAYTAVATLAVLSCGDVAGPGSFEGTWAGSNSTYKTVTLTLTPGGPGALGTLLLRDSAGVTQWDGPVGGPVTGPGRVLVKGFRAPSSGGGEVALDGVVQVLGLRVALTSTWLPATTLTLVRVAK